MMHKANHKAWVYLCGPCIKPYHSPKGSVLGHGALTWALDQQFAQSSDDNYQSHDGMVVELTDHFCFLILRLIISIASSSFSENDLEIQTGRCGHLQNERET